MLKYLKFFVFKAALIGLLLNNVNLAKGEKIEYYAPVKKKKSNTYFLKEKIFMLLTNLLSIALLLFTLSQKRSSTPIKNKKEPVRPEQGVSNNFLNTSVEEKPKRSHLFPPKKELEQLYRHYSFPPRAHRTTNPNFIPAGYNLKKIQTDEDKLNAYLDYFEGRIQDNDRLNAKIIQNHFKKKAWKEIRKGHYDWILFPNDRKTANAGWSYCFTPKLLKLLLQKEEWKKKYEEAIYQVILAYGFDLKKGRWVDKKRCQIYAVRFMKILYSTILTQNLAYYKKMVRFIEALHKDQSLLTILKKDKDYKWIKLYAQITA